MDSDGIERVRRTAALARLDLDEGEAALFGPQFQAILENFKVLAELDLEHEEPMTSPLPPGDVDRADEARPSSPRSKLVDVAPDPRDGFYSVPKTIGGVQ